MGVDIGGCLDIIRYYITFWWFFVEANSKAYNRRQYSKEE